MATPLIPQEIYLLERYISLERFGKMRDAWREMLNFAEDLLNRFMQNLPPDYRNRPLPEQPDIVWGERVLPNFRNTMQLLADGYIKLSHGDFEALGRAHGVTGGIRGQRDFWSGWMDEVEPGAESKYYELLFKAEELADPIAITSSGIWSPGDLTTDYDAVIKEPLNPPPAWPTYRLNPQVKVKSGDRTPQTGIYLPDIDHGFPTLLRKSDDDVMGEANEASVVLDPSVSSQKGYRPTTWTLIERIADNNDKPIPPSQTVAARLRAEKEPLRARAGRPCPKSGIWQAMDTQTVERPYRAGDIMADLHSAYGFTIWRWIRDL